MAHTKRQSSGVRQGLKQRKLSTIVRQAVCLAERPGQKVAYKALALAADRDGETGAFCAVGFINAAWAKSTNPRTVQNLEYGIAQNITVAAGIPAREGSDWLVEKNDGQNPDADGRYLLTPGRRAVIRRLKTLAKRLERRGL